LTAPRRWLGLIVGTALLAVTLPGCLVVPGDTWQIEFVSTSTDSGWKYDFYRNNAYRCAINDGLLAKVRNSPAGWL
jgi:hypothetical protein